MEIIDILTQTTQQKVKIIVLVKVVTPSWMHANFQKLKKIKKNYVKKHIDGWMQ